MRLLHRLGVEEDVIEGGEFSLVLRRVCGPELLVDPQVLVGRPATRLERRRAHRRELLGHPAGADADDGPPAREQVDGGEKLRRQHGLAVGHDHHRGEQPHLAGDAGQVSHQRQRLQALAGEQGGEIERAVGRIGVGRIDALGHHDVIRDRENSVAQLFAVLGDGPDVLRHGQRPAVWYVEPVFHSPVPSVRRFTVMRRPRGAGDGSSPDISPVSRPASRPRTHT